MLQAVWAALNHARLNTGESKSRSLGRQKKYIASARLKSGDFCSPVFILSFTTAPFQLVLLVLALSNLPAMQITQSRVIIAHKVDS